MIKAMRGLCGLAICASLLALVGSFAGALHPVGDSLAVFRVQAALAAILSAVLLMLLGLRWAGLFVAGAVVALGPVLAATLWPQTQPEQSISLYQKNLLYQLSDTTLVIADIRITDPDVLTLQEVPQGNKLVLEGLRDRLPSQIHCSASGIGGVAIASKWPMVPGSAKCPNIRGVAAMQVDAPLGPLWLVSLHLHWPYPYRQVQQLQRVVPFLEGLDGPILLGGDFNMVPWSHTHSQIARATGGRRIGTAQSSFPRFHPWVPLPIDHVFAPGRGSINLRPLLGSDHFGVLARIELDVD